MHEHHRLAPIDLLEHRRESGIAQELAGITRHQSDAVELENIERVIDLGQAAIGVGQRDGGEHAEPAGIIADQLRAELIAGAGARPRRRAVFEPDARTGDRIDGGGNAGLVHLLDRALHRPVLRARRIGAVGRDGLL
jgi:hypothetical protein